MSSAPNRLETSLLEPSEPDRSALLRTLVEVRADLVHFLARRLTCRSTAEDIAQDVFLRLSSLPVAARHPRALIFRTASNLAFNHRRDEKRQAEIRATMIAPAESAVEERTPEREAIALDLLRRLARELAHWPERTREVFILNRYDGLNQREIAERLHLSSTSIERHMARAIRNIAALAAKGGW
ncbi:MAG: sigma-70 family RNA polymerase sigma factor [Candidatus Andeanibacterium colombiense]|uniref:Sigma-70 family RNA polymerase sigma factor n=1 Tax=Candidatus Andeanibacterium colombiense TaxID=3121345 RepID=A0AAJ6BR39_9SPHN|nr:MAG: sigma-70 family RNA polymerase sigma factor [Sphingomonadaceae bacterium]